MSIKNCKALVMVLTLVLLVSGCSGNGNESENGGNGEGAKSQYLNLVLAAEPTTLDPSKGSDSYSNSVLNNVLEPLTRLEENQNQENFVAPAGAESWEYNDDGTVWTFKIRENLWSDGEPVTAYDYEYGIKRSVDPNTASPYAYLLEPIKNASAVNRGSLAVDELGVKALDDRTLEITLEATTPYFLSLTYQRVMLPQRQDIVEAHGDRYGSSVDSIVYNGPFILDSWVHNSELKFIKNEYYWDADTVQLEKVNLRIIQDENAVLNSFANGSIDATTTNNQEWRNRFMNQANVNHFETINPTTFFLFFNTNDEIFQNENIRKAFSIAVNREEIANVIFNGVHTPAHGWVAPNINIGDTEYRSVVEGPVEKLIRENDANDLLVKGLEELGRSTDPADLTIEISLGGTDQWFRTYGEYLQQMFQNTLGITVKIRQLEWPTFSQNVSRGDFQVGYMAWGSEFDDPAALMSLHTSTSNAIGHGWSSDRYDELISLANNEMDQEKRIEYFREAEEMLLYQYAVLSPVVHPRSNVFRYNYVNGLGVTPFGTSGWKYGSIDGR